MSEDMQKFLDALKAKDWLHVFIYGLKLATDLASLFGTHQQAKKAMAPKPNDLGVLTALFEDEMKYVQAGKINPGNLLAIVLAILKLLFPLLSPLGLERAEPA